MPSPRLSRLSWPPVCRHLRAAATLDYDFTPLVAPSRSARTWRPSTTIFRLAADVAVAASLRHLGGRPVPGNGSRCASPVRVPEPDRRLLFFFGDHSSSSGPGCSSTLCPCSSFSAPAAWSRLRRCWPAVSAASARRPGERRSPASSSCSPFTPSPCGFRNGRTIPRFQWYYERYDRNFLRLDGLDRQRRPWPRPA